MIPTFRIGESITVGIKVDSGDPASVSGVTARMVRSASGEQFRRARGAAAVPMTVTARAAAGSVPAGWNITLAASSTRALKPGIYGIDAFHAVGGSTELLTEVTQLIRLTEAAS